MLDHARRRLSYANVMSTLAVFIALGGSSYAAVKINGSAIKTRSIAASKLKRNTLSGLEIRERSLGRVPHAEIADSAFSLEGVTARDLKLGCPTDTFATTDVCIEKVPRHASSYGSAILECDSVNAPAGSERRLPTHGELRNALAGVELAPGGELTSDIVPSSTRTGELDVIYVTDQVGSIGVTPNRGEGAKAFRCAIDPLQ